MLIDTHAHLDDERFRGVEDEIVARANECGVNKIITIGTDMVSSQANVAISHKYQGVFAAVGVHPHEASDINDEEQYQQLIVLAKNKKVVAIGEIGLDYHYDHSPRAKQQEVFSRQLAIAADLDLPVIVHDREAHADTLNILRRDAAGLRGVLHCFSGSLEMAREVTKMGFLISIAGPVTYPNAAKLQRVVAELPLECLLIETDSPYLAPQSKRGKRNEPAFVRYIAEMIAEIKGTDVEEVAKVTTNNAQRLFKL